METYKDIVMVAQRRDLELDWQDFFCTDGERGI